MKHYQSFNIFSIFFIAFTLTAQTSGKESYIDIPSANFTKGLFVNTNGSYPFGSENEVTTDFNAGLELAINRFNAILNWYSTSDFCIGLSYQILEQNGMIPSLSLGIDNLTYRKYISPIGHAIGDTTNTYSDEGYDPRPQEVASAYLVTSRRFNENFEITIGMGRGRFVGYGPLSRLLNFDVFFDEEHETFAIGVFGGLKLSIPHGLSFLVETDGRDANLGMQYEYGLFKGAIGFTKLEHLFYEEELPITPRVNVSFSVKALSFEKPRKGQLNIRLLAKETGRPIQGRLTYENGEKRVVDIPPTGRITVTLDSGVYLFRLSSPDYKIKQAKISLRPNQVMNFTVKLSEKLTPDIISSLELTTMASENFKNNKLKEAKMKLEAALRLYPESEKAKEGLQLVENAIKYHVSGLKEEARSLEATDLEKAITIWLEVKSWEFTNEVERHIQDLRNRLASVKSEPKPKKTPTPKKKKLSLSKTEIENLYKLGIKEYVQGNYSKAVNHFQKILDADPNHTGAKHYLRKAKEKL